MQRDHVEALELLIKSGRCSQEDLKAFSEKELEYIAKSTFEFLKTGESLTLKAIEESDYEFEVPHIHKFIEDPFYLGNDLGYPLNDSGVPLIGEKRQIYDYWWDTLDRIYNSEHPYTEILITGGIGGGKTTAMNIIALMDFVKLIALRNPQRHYGLMPSTEIVFAFFNILKDLAFDVGYGQFHHMMDTSPFFNKIMVRNTKLREGFQLQPPGRKRIGFRTGSRITHTLGIAVFFAEMDEANFGTDTTDKKSDEKKSQVYTNYTNLMRRKESRFLNAPGHFCIASSKKAESDFLEDHIENSKGRPGVLVIDEPQYVYKKCRGEYSKKTFRVLLGDMTRDPRILKEGEEVTEELKMQIIEVPDNFKRAFEDNIIDALRDVAGKASQPKYAFITNRNAIRAGVDTVRKPPWKFTSRGKNISNTINLSFFGKDQIGDFLILELLFLDKGRLKYPDSPRYLSFDTGVTGDAAAAAMVCRAGIKMLESGKDKKKYFIPKYWQDFVIRIKGKGGEQFPLYKLTEFTKFLYQELHIPLVGVATDGYQATQLRQDVKIAMPSLNVELLSVDKDDIAYVAMRNILYAQALEGFYEDANDLVELFDLKHISTSSRGSVGNMMKMKVDHPVIASDGFVGRKDVNDARASALFQCKELDRTISTDEIKLEMEQYKDINIDKETEQAEKEVDRILAEVDKLKIEDIFNTL